MSYSNKLLQSPKKKSLPNDRFISPCNSPVVQRTPEKSIKSKVNPTHSPTFKVAQDRFMPPLSPHFNFQSVSDLVSSPVRQPVGFQSFPTQSRIFPTKPTHSIPLTRINWDFYISILDWSIRDIITLASERNLLLINPKSTEKTKATREISHQIELVKCNPSNPLCLLGLSDGKLEFYDLKASSVASKYCIFDNVSPISGDYAENLIAVGNRKGTLAIIDDRTDEIIMHEDIHNEELCQVRFSSRTSPNYYCTSSNDTTAKIWDLRGSATEPLTKFTKHEAAIKAMAWSPFTSNIICTGGGTQDKTVKIWNTQTGEVIKSASTGSQVCNLYWNPEYNEIVSTQGYSQNHIIVWKGSDLTQLTALFTHKDRILYMAPSPDDQSFASVAPCESLQIWKMFPKIASDSLNIIR